MGMDRETEAQKLKSVAPGHPVREWQSWHSSSGVSVRSKLGPFTWATLKVQSGKLAGTQAISWMGKLRLGGPQEVPTCQDSPWAQPSPTVISLSCPIRARWGARGSHRPQGEGNEDIFPCFTEGEPEA